MYLFTTTWACRRTIKVNSDTEHVMTAYMSEAGQPERKVAEMTFKRTSQGAAR